MKDDSRVLQAQRALELVEALREIHQEPEQALEILLAAVAIILRMTSRNEAEALENADSLHGSMRKCVVTQFQVAAIIAQIEAEQTAGKLQ